MREYLAGVACALAVLLSTGACTAATFVVNDTTDAHDANPGNGLCATSTGGCTLRAAIEESNTLAGADAIMLPLVTAKLWRAHSLRHRV